MICSACLEMHTFAARLWAFVKPWRVRTNPGWVRLTSCQAWRLRGSCCPAFQTVFSSNLSNKFVLGSVAVLTSLNTSFRPPNVLPPSGHPLFFLLQGTTPDVPSIGLDLEFKVEGLRILSPYNVESSGKWQMEWKLGEYRDLRNLI